MNLQTTTIYLTVLIILLGSCGTKEKSAFSTKEYNKQGKGAVVAKHKPASTKPEELVDSIKPKNIIFLIGDGMGVAQVYLGLTANKGKLNLEQFQCLGYSKTYSSDNYITDSAAGATAFSIGKKTYNGALGVTPDKKAHQTILERAEQEGLATGLVATCKLTHATPAAFIAHQPSRKMHQEIATDFLKTDVDVIIGGGLDAFVKRDDKKNLVDSLKEKGYTFAGDIEQVKSHKEGKLAALLYPGHPPTFADGRGDMLGVGTMKAIELLSKNEKGFFLMAEASQIDWAGHDNDGVYVANEVIDFDNTIGQVLDWARQNGETLVVVTADHETGGCTIAGGDMKTGKIKAKFCSTGHTGIMVPVFAYGPGAEAFMGIYENTAIYSKFMNAFGFK